MKTTVGAIVLVLVSGGAWADDIRIRQPGPSGQADLAEISEDLTAAFSYKPLGPAAPLGLLGFHANALLSYTATEHEDAWRRITAGEKIGELPLLGVSAGKGLIAGLDVGAFFADSPTTNVEVFGGELRYAFAEGGLISPALSLRASYTKMVGADDLDFSTRALDVSISKGFVLLTPYAGMGRVWGRAEPNVATLEEVDVKNNKLYAGLKIDLLVLQLVLEVDQTGDNSSYNLRLGFGL